MSTLINIELIINRLKKTLNITSDSELADKLGVGKSTISNWRKRNSIDYTTIFTLCEHIDLNYLIYGEVKEDGVAYKTISESQSKLISSLEKQIERLEAELAKRDAQMGGDAGCAGADMSETA